MQSFLPAFVKHLLCAKLRSKHWGHSKADQKEKIPGADISVGRSP